MGGRFPVCVLKSSRLLLTSCRLEWLLLVNLTVLGSTLSFLGSFFCRFGAQDLPLPMPASAGSAPPAGPALPGGVQQVLQAGASFPARFLPTAVGCRTGLLGCLDLLLLGASRCLCLPSSCRLAGGWPGSAGHA